MTGINSTCRFLFQERLPTQKSKVYIPLLIISLNRDEK